MALSKELYKRLTEIDNEAPRTLSRAICTLLNRTPRDVEIEESVLHWLRGRQDIRPYDLSERYDVIRMEPAQLTRIRDQVMTLGHERLKDDCRAFLNALAEVQFSRPIYLPRRAYVGCFYPKVSPAEIRAKLDAKLNALIELAVDAAGEYWGSTYGAKSTLSVSAIPYCDTLIFPMCMYALSDLLRERYGVSVEFRQQSLFSRNDLNKSDVDIGVSISPDDLFLIQAEFQAVYAEPQRIFAPLPARMLEKLSEDRHREAYIPIIPFIGRFGPGKRTARGEVSEIIAHSLGLEKVHFVRHGPEDDKAYDLFSDKMVDVEREILLLSLFGEGASIAVVPSAEASIWVLESGLGSYIAPGPHNLLELNRGTGLMLEVGEVGPDTELGFFVRGREARKDGLPKDKGAQRRVVSTLHAVFGEVKRALGNIDSETDEPADRSVYETWASALMMPLQNILGHTAPAINFVSSRELVLRASDRSRTGASADGKRSGAEIVELPVRLKASPT